MGFILSFGLVEPNSFIQYSGFIKALLTLMDVIVINLRKTLLLYFIFKKLDVRKVESGSVTEYSHQFIVDSSHKWELTEHSSS